MIEVISEIAPVVIHVQLEPFMMVNSSLLNALNVRQDHFKVKQVHMSVFLVCQVLFKKRKVNQSVYNVEKEGIVVTHHQTHVTEDLHLAHQVHIMNFVEASTKLRVYHVHLVSNIGV